MNNCCTKPDTRNINESEEHFNRICYHCGAHWYGVEKKFYTRREWDIFMEDGDDGGNKPHTVINHYDIIKLY